MSTNDEQDHQMRMNGMTPSGIPFQAFACKEIGMTMRENKVEQLPNGTWKASCPIGTLFGQEVEGECSGCGKTKEEALTALAKDRQNLNNSLWA